MNRRETPTIKDIPKILPDVTLQPVDMYEPNFGLLASDSSWRDTWSHIIPGRFSRSLYSGLLFVEHTTGFAELYDTDGRGHIRTPLLGQFDPLGERATWTHIVPGYFGPSGFTGLLLYDREAGFGRFFDSDGHGRFLLLKEYSGWRTSWTHVVAGRFLASSPYSSVFFYDAQQKSGEVWATNGKGLADNAPRHTFTHDADTSFTHVLAGDFHWTPGFIDSVPTLSDLFFYDTNSGRGEMHRCDTSAEGGVVFEKTAASYTLSRNATSVIAGNFGGFGNTDVAFFDGATGTVNFVAFKDTSDTTADIVLRETQSGLRVNPTTIAVAGNFWMANEDDHWFNDGPPVSSRPRFDPDWRFGTGTFSDLLFYERSAGRGDFYFHEPLAPPLNPLEGYITSTTEHRGWWPLSTGSVLPGETISFHVSSQHGPYTIEILRQGLFDDGAFEQPMATIEGLPDAPAPFLIPRNAYRDGAQWPPVASFRIPDWPSGLYIARVQTKAAPFYTTDLPFVVRAPRDATSGVLLVLNDSSWNAYNDWGMRNSYYHLTGAEAAGAYPAMSALRIPYGFELSFERPLHAAFFNSPQTWEIPFVRWLARMGITVDVCTSRDIHFHPPNTQEYHLVLFAGHPEYWTAQMRTNVEGFANVGRNIAFFGGNICWWQIRIGDDGRKFACYKIADFDPVSTTADRALTTVHWFDDLVKRPETKLTGVSWLGDNAYFEDQAHRFTVARADHWVFAGTGLRNGDKFGGYSSNHDEVEDRSVAGFETDRVQTNGPNGLKSPSGYTLASIFDPEFTSLEVGTMGIFRRTSRTGEVFNAATTNWALGLNIDDRHWNVIDQITHNVVTRLGWGMSAVSQGKSIPGGPVTAVLLAPDRIALFLADDLGEIYTSAGHPDHGWAPWTSVSGGATAPGGHIAAVLTAKNRVTLFVTDPQGALFTTSGIGNNWEPWTGVSGGAITPGGHITAVLTATNRVTIFVANHEGTVFTTSGIGTQWAEWRIVSGGVSAPGGHVTAVLTAKNRVTLFVTDPHGGIFTTSGFGNNWEPWTGVSGGAMTPGGHITPVLTATNRVTIFLANHEGTVFTTSGIGTQWAQWRTVSDGMSAPGGHISAALTAANRVTLFLADPGGSIFTNSGIGKDWAGWSSVTHARTTPGAPIFALSMPSRKVRLVFADWTGRVYVSTTELPLK